MKKIITLLMLLCTCIGAWADFTPKTVEGTTQYCYTLQCAASDHGAFIGLTETSFNGRSAKGTLIVFEPTGTPGQYYLRVVARNKYINKGANVGDNVTFDAVPTTYWTITQTGDRIFLNADGATGNYLNNAVTSGVCLRSANANGNCSKWLPTEYSYTLPTVPQDAKLYRFKNKNYSSNDYMTAEGNDLKGRSKANNNTQWFFTIDSGTENQVYLASAVDGRTAQEVAQSTQVNLGYAKTTKYIFTANDFSGETYYGICQSDRTYSNNNSSLHRDGSSNIVGWNSNSSTDASMWKMEEIGSDELGSYLTAQKVISHALEANEQCVVEELALRLKMSTASQKYYYTLKDTKGRNRYAYYNGDDQLLGTDGSGNIDNRLFYFTQSDAQKALSNSSYMVVSIHNLVAEGKEMASKDAWGTTETNWYIKISPKVPLANYIAICPNSNFDGNSWNDYSTTVNNYGANDPNSAWELTQVSNVKNFTVQVSGLPVSTDMAGVTVCGKNYNNGATVTSAYVENMTAMEVPGYTALVTGYNNNLRVAYTEKIKASAAPDNGEWAANTTWYYIKSKNSNGYISNGSAYKQDANFKFDNTTKPTDADGLWALVYNEETGTYKIYNKNAGTNSVMAHNATTDNSPVYLANSADAANSDFIFEPGVQAGTYCIRINGTTNARWNNRTYLSTWTSNDSFYGGGTQSNVTGGWGAGATGSQYVFEIFDPSEDIISSWNNYNGDNQTEWTQGTDAMTTANTANRSSHYYNESAFQTTDHFGSVTLRFQYGSGSNGSARLDISGVELLNADGTEVLSSDIHNGYTGNYQDNRDYTITVPAKNTAYKLRIWTFGTRNSHGTITYMNWGSNPASGLDIALAKAIINDGVGYPKATTTAYTALAGLTAGTITKDAVAAAKAAYIAETNINLPVSGKAYKLNFLHNNTAKTKRYIKYDANGLGLTTEAGEAATILFTEVDATNHKYIMTLSDGNLLTWHGDGNEGFKVDGATAKGYSTMVANQGNNDDWNLCWFANQGTDEAQLGTIKMSSPRHASNAANSCWVISNAGAWAKANEASFFASNGATSALQFEEVAGVTGETTGYADGVEKYTLYTTAKSNETTYASYFGTGLGKYHYGENQTTGYMDAVKACTTLEQERAIVPVSINQPETGKFYAFKAVQRNKYLANTVNDGGTLLEAESKNDAIFYLTAGESAGQVKLLSYKNGQYAGGTGLAAVGSSNYYTIEQAKNGSAVNILGKYALVTNESHRLNMWENGYVRDNGTNYNNWEGWTIEEVEALPVKMNAVNGKYYGTINLPVAVTLPAGLKAYSAVASGDVLTLTKVAGEDTEETTLAAGTPVILYAESDVTSLTFAAEGASADRNELRGTVAAVSVTANDNYVLSGSQGVGFYKYNNTVMPGFKAYLPAATSNANKLSFRFDDVLTAIEAVENPGSTTEIYDLQGRRLQKAQQGMNIINGHKVLVK